MMPSDGCESLVAQSRFPGKERDAETGLDYFGARFYGSTLARFTIPDPLASIRPLRVTVEHPQRFNPYAYADNNPLANIDSDGHFSFPVHEGATASAATGLGYGAGSAAMLVHANAYVDRPGNTVNNREHGMSDTVGDNSDAAAQINHVIEGRRADAVTQAAKGDYAGALNSLGQGLHTVQDLVAHQGITLGEHPLGEPADKDVGMQNDARRQSEQYMRQFEKELAAAVGGDKAKEILNKLKDFNEATETQDKQLKTQANKEPGSEAKSEKAVQ